MSRFVLTPAARADVEEIHDFIHLDSPAAAARLRVALRDAMRRLAMHPHLGHVRRGRRSASGPSSPTSWSTARTPTLSRSCGSSTPPATCGACCRRSEPVQVLRAKWSHPKASVVDGAREETSSSPTLF
ncbi:MAG: type II toxin-antitoxin system RelE/ParE family toxin [Thermoanaerobaculia bacterium]